MVAAVEVIKMADMASAKAVTATHREDLADVTRRAVTTRHDPARERLNLISCTIPCFGRGRSETLLAYPRIRVTRNEKRQSLIEQARSMVGQDVSILGTLDHRRMNHLLLRNFFPMPCVICVIRGSLPREHGLEHVPARSDFADDCYQSDLLYSVEARNVTPQSQNITLYRSRDFE